jgi:hypothetical protein
LERELEVLYLCCRSILRVTRKWQTGQYDNRGDH